MATKRTVMVPFGGVVVTFTKVDQTVMLPFGGAVVDAKIVAAGGGFQPAWARQANVIIQQVKQ